MWDLIVSVPDHCLSFYLGLKDVGTKGLMLLFLLLVTNLSFIFFLHFLGRGCLAFTGSFRFRLGAFAFLVFLFLRSGTLSSHQFITIPSNQTSDNYTT